jgi:hypothetical protein
LRGNLRRGAARGTRGGGFAPSSDVDVEEDLPDVDQADQLGYLPRLSFSPPYSAPESANLPLPSPGPGPQSPPVSQSFSGHGQQSLPAHHVPQADPNQHHAPHEHHEEQNRTGPLTVQAVAAGGESKGDLNNKNSYQGA